MIEVIIWGKGRVFVKDLNRMKKSIVLAIGILLASASFTPIISVHAKMTSQELIQKKIIIDKKIIQLEREIERLQVNLQCRVVRLVESIYSRIWTLHINDLSKSRIALARIVFDKFFMVH